jgi:hypothetical protein
LKKILRIFFENINICSYCFFVVCTFNY